MPLLWMINSHEERRPKICSYTWNTKIWRTGEEPHLSSSHPLNLLRADTECVHLPLREMCYRAGPQQEPPCSHSHPSGQTSSFPSLRSGAVPSYHWKLKAQIYAMTKPSHSWFKLTWALGNLLEDPLVTRLLKWNLVVKNKFINVTIFVLEVQF